VGWGGGWGPNWHQMLYFRVYTPHSTQYRINTAPDWHQMLYFRVCVCVSGSVWGCSEGQHNTDAHRMHTECTQMHTDAHRCTQNAHRMHTECNTDATQTQWPPKATKQHQPGPLWGQIWSLDTSQKSSNPEISQVSFLTTLQHETHVFAVPWTPSLSRTRLKNKLQTQVSPRPIFLVQTGPGEALGPFKPQLNLN
jgi:hypothetical protein